MIEQYWLGKTKLTDQSKCFLNIATELEILTPKPTAIKKMYALKMHNLENWIICMPFGTPSLVQKLLNENYKHHATHH